jgi:hypothetical protein
MPSSSAASSQAGEVQQARSWGRGSGVGAEMLQHFQQPIYLRSAKGAWVSCKGTRPAAIGQPAASLACDGAYRERTGDLRLATRPITRPHLTPVDRIGMTEPDSAFSSNLIRHRSTAVRSHRACTVDAELVNTCDYTLSHSV